MKYKVESYSRYGYDGSAGLGGHLVVWLSDSVHVNKKWYPYERREGKEWMPSTVSISGLDDLNQKETIGVASRIYVAALVAEQLDQNPEVEYVEVYETPTAREIFIPDEYWQPSEIPALIKSLVIFLLVIEAIKKDPSLTEVDTREVWRVAAPLVMDILGAVWGE